MKNYIKYIICSLSLVCFGTSFAQNLSWYEQRLFRLNVYNAIEDYERFGSFYNEDYKDGFIGMFESGNLQIYNDLLGISTAPTLSVYDYIRCVDEKVEFFDVSIKNINIGNLYEVNGKWLVNVTFDKEVMSFNKNGLPLSSRAYYGADYRMTVTFVRENDEDVSIVALNGEMKSEKVPLPDEYFAVQRSKIKDKKGNEVPNPRDLSVLCNNKGLDFMDVAEMTYALVPGAFDKAKFTYSRDNDIDVKPVSVNNSPGLYYLKYNPKHWRLKVRSDLTIGDYYVFETEKKQNDNIQTKSSSNEFALELGYVFPSSKKLKAGIFFGGGVALNKFEMGIDSWTYSSSTTGSADIDGDSYVRHYSLQGLKQTFATTDVVLPVYFDFECRFSKWFSMYLDLGAKAYYNLESNIESLEGKYTTYGVYKDYDNLKLDYKSGINGFVNNENLTNEMLSSDVIKPEQFSFDAFGSLGFRVGIGKSLQIGCGATYQMGLTEYFKNTNTVITNGAGKKPNNVLMMYSASKNKENVRSLIETKETVKRQAIKVNVELILKF